MFNPINEWLRACPREQEGAAGGGPDGGEGKGGAGGDPAPGAGDDFGWLGEGVELSDDDRAYLSAKSFKGPGDLYKSLRAAESAIRGDKIPAPPIEPEKIADWLARTGVAKSLGVPDSAEGYSADAPEIPPELAQIVDWKPERDARAREAALAAGLTAKQMEAMRNWFVGEAIGQAKDVHSAVSADTAEMETELDKAWGDRRGDMERLAAEVAGKYGLDTNKIEALRMSNVIGSASLMRLLGDLGSATADDQLRGGGKTTDFGRLTPEQARDELKSFEAENGAAITTRADPKHEIMVDRWNKLRARAGL